MVRVMPTDTELKARAIAVWVRAHPHREPPALSSTTVEEYDGLTYVILRRNKQVVGVCRWREATPGTPYPQLSLLRRYYPGPYGRQRVAA